LSVDPSKKINQLAPSSYATLVAPSAGVTGSTTLSTAEAWEFYRRTAEFLQGLKNRETYQQGNPFTLPLFLFSISLADLRPFPFTVLANDLNAAQKALLDEKSVRLGVKNSLAEEKASRQAADQSLQQFKDSNATLALARERTDLSCCYS
jgi:hypothetical protein